MNFKKESLLLYGITDRSWINNITLYEQVELALKGGITLLQLREKNLDEESFVIEAVEIRNLCHKYNVPLIINDNLNVALKSGADGIHVGINDIAVESIRKKTNKDFIIGATAKTLEQALYAEESGADYLGVGAVFASPTKKDAIRISKEQFNSISEAVNIPIVAIGGITYDNILQLKEYKTHGIAVISAIFSGDILDNSIHLRKRSELLFGN